MKFAASLIRPLVLLTFLAIIGSTGSLRAQDVSEAHIKAARAAIDALNATDPFDEIIITLSTQLKAQLYQKNPDMQETISQIVDETALEMAGRRADLEREAELAYASVFSEQELNEIAAFYNSNTGKKLLSDHPIVMRKLITHAETWQAGIARDLGEAVGKKLEAIAGAAPAKDESGEKTE